MITPVAQRQMFQTAHVEALRQAHEVSDQIQREAAKQKAADDRMTTEMEEIHQVARADALRTEERRQGRQGGRQQGEGHEAEGEGEGGGAAPADPHLDLLA